MRKVHGDTSAAPEAAHDVLLTVSGVIPTDVQEQVRRGERPRPDYLAMADAFGADLLDHNGARALTGRFGGFLERLGGPHLVLAWACFLLRHRYRVVFTDGEQVGLPYAALTRLIRRRPEHLMITHIMSVPKKEALFRALALGGRIDRIFVYATAQKRFAEQRLGLPPDRVVLTPFTVDTEFFKPASRPTRRMVCAAGLEWRDYPTLIEAVKGLDVTVVLAAASPWSKREDTTEAVDIPDNVEVCRLGFVELRALYAESLFVVMPLYDVPFQAGVTTILEAMAMGKAVITSRTTGQTDVVVEGETGLYVPPGSVSDLRQAILTLLDDPRTSRAMGQAGRRRVVADMDVATYASRLGSYVSSQDASGASAGGASEDASGASGSTRGHAHQVASRLRRGTGP